MSSIVKRRKTVEYLQLHNHPVQKDLDDLSAIGLLTYIMSLPEDWTLYKTQLQSKFSRRKVDGAWKVLVEKKYIIGFICYVDRKKTYLYNVSDIPFTENDFLQFVDDNLEIFLKENTYVSSLKEIPDSPYQIPDIEGIISTVQNAQYGTEQNVQYSTEQFVQYKQYNSIRTVQSVHIQNKYKTNETKTKKTDTKETGENSVNKNVNKESKDIYQEPILKLTNEYRLKGLSKELCLKVADQVVERDKESKLDNFGGYLRNALEITLRNKLIKDGADIFEVSKNLDGIPDYLKFDYATGKFKTEDPFGSPEVHINPDDLPF